MEKEGVGERAATSTSFPSLVLLFSFSRQCSSSGSPSASPSPIGVRRRRGLKMDSTTASKRQQEEASFSYVEDPSLRFLGDLLTRRPRASLPLRRTLFLHSSIVPSSLSSSSFNHGAGRRSRISTSTRTSDLVHLSQALPCFSTSSRSPIAISRFTATRERFTHWQ
jgi:hypothetical protein